MFDISKDELPEKESWQDICQELGRNGLDDTVCREFGIRIILRDGRKGEGDGYKEHAAV